MDNLFVFVLVFDYFKVPLENQQRVLTYGIGGAMAMRRDDRRGLRGGDQLKPVLLPGSSSSAPTSS